MHKISKSIRDSQERVWYSLIFNELVIVDLIIEEQDKHFRKARRQI